MDDLWSVFYVTVENLVGQLPWRLVTDKTVVQHLKETIDLFEPDTHPGLPIELAREGEWPPPCLKILHSCLKSYDFFSDPDYALILGVLVSPCPFSESRSQMEEMEQRGFGVDELLDWERPRLHHSHHSSQYSRRHVTAA